MTKFLSYIPPIETTAIIVTIVTIIIVSLIEYFNWRQMKKLDSNFIIIIIFVSIIIFATISAVLEAYDNGGHNGVKTCQEQMNLTSDEIRIINEIRIKKIIEANER